MPFSDQLHLLGTSLSIFHWTGPFLDLILSSKDEHTQEKSLTVHFEYVRRRFLPSKVSRQSLYINFPKFIRHFLSLFRRGAPKLWLWWKEFFVLEPYPGRGLRLPAEQQRWAEKE